MIDHKKQRRIIEWNWPNRLVELTEAWDGIEDRQSYLDRAATWDGIPITPAEIDAEEANYDAAQLVAVQDRQDEVDRETLRSAGERIAFVLVELVETLLAKNIIAASDFSPNVRTVYQEVKTIAERVKP